MPGLAAATPVESSGSCAHGCGEAARFRTKAGVLMCQPFSSQCAAVRVKAKAGLSKAYSEGRKTVHPNFLLSAAAIRPGIWNRQHELAKARLRDLPFDDLSHELKRKRILNDQGGRCLICNMEPLWNGQPLTFHLDHIRGKQAGNGRENLRMICPNCHSQTDTWCSKNISSEGKKRIAEAARKQCGNRIRLEQRRGVL